MKTSERLAQTTSKVVEVALAGTENIAETNQVLLAALFAMLEQKIESRMVKKYGLKEVK